MDSAMTIKFWGVRGSIPSPGPNTVRYGGNTSCVSIDTGSKEILILDAGTGIRELGKALEGGGQEIFIMLSHRHWDHIQGFPFFGPLYECNRKINILSTEDDEGMICSLIAQMDGAHFPVEPATLPSLLRCIHDNVTDFFKRHGFRITQIATNHPGHGFGYRIERDGRSVVYLTDNELDPPYKKVTGFDTFINFCHEADLLIHDAQYMEEDIPQKHGWGHSLVSQVCTLAEAAQVKHLVLTHHDPDRTDDALDSIQHKSREWLKGKKQDIMCTVAYEGLTIQI